VSLIQKCERVIPDNQLVWWFNPKSKFEKNILEKNLWEFFFRHLKIFWNMQIRVWTKSEQSWTLRQKISEVQETWNYNFSWTKKSQNCTCTSFRTWRISWNQKFNLAIFWEGWVCKLFSRNDPKCRLESDTLLQYNICKKSENYFCRSFRTLRIFR